MRKDYGIENLKFEEFDNSIDDPKWRMITPHFYKTISLFELTTIRNALTALLNNHHKRVNYKNAKTQ